MAWKDSVNSVLSRATGYRLVRGEQPSEEPAPEAKGPAGPAPVSPELAAARRQREEDARRIREREIARRKEAAERIEAARAAAHGKDTSARG